MAAPHPPRGHVVTPGELVDWNRLDRLIEEALAIPDDGREAFLSRTCGDDRELYARALAILEHHDPSARYFSALGAGIAADSELSDMPLRRIGPYQLLEVLGEGGMGRVWLAEQKEPVRRQVALKVLKLGMDTEQIVARFESERQALAFMDHPCIARVFDGGTTPEGRPYFAMEYVEGAFITRYCDTRRLDVQARVRLFIEVCRAVQHAHMKGVIHRDIKPSNVLVSDREGAPAPKVIDFGIAKAVTGSLTDRTLVTSMGQMVGTPAYMSPEQADPRGRDVDSRTDVYSLGIVLYEILAGALPFDFDPAREPGSVLSYLLGDQAVPTPSARLSTLADTQEAVADLRGCQARELRSTLQGDLDWIVMKALERDRERRYETVNELADDLGRYLGHEPVVARPPTAAYRFRRFARRHRAGVVGAVATAVTLILGMVGTSIGLVRARAAEAAAQQEAEAAGQIADFLSGLFWGPGPVQARNAGMTALDLLNLGAERVRADLVDQPLVQAQLLQSIGEAYGELFLPERAVALFDEALVIRERELGSDHIEVARTLAELSRRVGEAGQRDRMEDLLFRAIPIYEREHGPQSIGVARAKFNLGIYYRNTGRLEEAFTMMSGAKEIYEGLEDQDTPRSELRDQSPRHLVARLHSHLAVAHRVQGEYDAAVDLAEQALETFRETLTPNHPQMVATLSVIAGVRMLQGRHEEAYRIYRDALDRQERGVGPWDPRTVGTIRNVARAASSLDRLSEADSLLDRALVVADSIHGSDSAPSADVHWELGNLALQTRDYVEAESHLRAALRQRESASAHGDVDELVGLLTVALEGQGRFDDAAALASPGATPDGPR